MLEWEVFPGDLSWGLVITAQELSGNLAMFNLLFQNLRSEQAELIKCMLSSVACRIRWTLHRLWVGKHSCVPTLLFSLEPPLVSIMTSTGSFEGCSIHYSASHSIITTKGTLHKRRGLNNNQAVGSKGNASGLFRLFVSFKLKKQKNLCCFILFSYLE